MATDQYSAVAAFEEWNEVAGVLPKGTGYYYECRSLFVDADAEIERLERERAEWSGIAATRNRNIAVIAEERDRFRGALLGYVRARRDGRGELAHWWWELQQIANEIAASGVASSASIAGVSPSPAPLAPQPSELVAKLLGFSSAYPEDMFPPLTKAEIAELPRGILDRASAAMGRHVAKFAKEAADAVEAQCREIERQEREKTELHRAIAAQTIVLLQAQHERDCAVEKLAESRQLLEDWMLSSDNFDLEAWMLKVRDFLEGSNPFSAVTDDVGAGNGS